MGPRNKAKNRCKQLHMITNLQNEHHWDIEKLLVFRELQCATAIRQIVQIQILQNKAKILLSVSYH